MGYWEADVTDSGQRDAAPARLPRVLVVDDDEIDRLQSKRLLTEIFGADLKLDFAADWDTARAAVASNNHDIYLIDYQLGPGTGLQLIEQATLAENDGIFVLLTGREDPTVDLEATRVGVADYLIKNELTVTRLERSLRYATESARQRLRLTEQAIELERAKAAVEAEVKKHLAVADDLRRTETRLTEALERAEEGERRHRWLGRHDMLTQIPNRVVFTEELANGLRQAARSGKRMALLLVDIDRFKGINDSFGHQVGDELLRQIADRMSTTVRESDVVARLGGDEFAVIATNLDAEDMAAFVADKLVAILSKPYDIDGHRIETGVSVGIAVADLEQADADRLISNADAALYRAKSDGRGSFRFFDQSLNDEVQRVLDVRRELPLAIESRSIYLAFQPKFEVSTGAVCGFEVLARWHHPELGQVSPSEFIAVAETSGLIGPLSCLIFDQALETAAGWRSTALADKPVAVNLSAHVLKSADLFAQITGLLSRHALAPANLSLEVTETAAVENVDLATAQLARLRELGITVSIDDFGTGYSSLAIATSLPADFLKIDLSFVAGALTRGADAAAVKSSIALAHSLGIRAVAEGVETQAQLDFLRQLGCDEVQGHFFAKPMSAQDLLRWSQQPDVNDQLRAVG